MEAPTDARRYSPSAARNRGPILDALRPRLPGAGLLLEVASGSGEHCAHLAAALPGLTFQPTDPDADALASINAWCGGLPNVRPALALDAAAAEWPVAAADAVLCINMIHIAPWAAAVGLVAGAARLLPPGGVLALYGPYLRGGRHTGPGNVAFDADLRARNPAWGVRSLEDVAALAAGAGFGAPEVVSMPADNLVVVFRHASATPP
jgi:SAM-dependent methyltransferase